MRCRWAAWIREYLEKHGGNVSGLCGVVTEEMCVVFPELRRTWGMVWSPRHGKYRHHWWLVAPDGEIVDPTMAQFESAEGLLPEDYCEKKMPVEATGRCLFCGLLLYGPSSFCDGECSRKFGEDLRSA